ncbi:MAG: hypothetical protein KGR26_02860 [Cyanobacteria bacterium REEB65]|nr:hypothetical protein [Cyanobacteria bacterium REEB65]
MEIPSIAKIVTGMAFPIVRGNVPGDLADKAVSAIDKELQKCLGRDARIAAASFKGNFPDYNKMSFKAIGSFKTLEGYKGMQLSGEVHLGESDPLPKAAGKMLPDSWVKTILKP